LNPTIVTLREVEKIFTDNTVQNPIIIGYDAKRALMNHSGLGSYSRNLLMGLTHAFPQNKYVLFSPKQKPEFREAVDFMTNHQATYVLPPEGTGKLGGTLWRTYKIANLAKAEGIQIYHGLSHELPSNIEKTGIRTLVTIHDLIFERYPSHYPFIDRLFYRKKIKEACEKADSIVAISEQTARDLLDMYQVNPKKLQVIYQSCDLVFSMDKSEEELMKVQEKFRLPKKFILCVGSFVERKNQLTLIKAMKFLKDETDYELVLVGKGGAYEEKIRRSIKHNDMQQKVHIINNCSTPELACIYRLSKIFVYPSLFEGFGIPIIEAMNSGVPVVTSNGSCFMETGGDACIYVDAMNEKQLANELLKLSQQDHLRQELIQKGFQHVKKFSQDKIAADYMRLYRSMMEKPLQEA
jgi:glycosyltransferase involved in cell wall biosynthesis